MKHFMRIFRTPWMCTESCAQLKNPLEQDHGRGQKHDDFHEVLCPRCRRLITLVCPFSEPLPRSARDRGRISRVVRACGHESGQHKWGSWSIPSVRFLYRRRAPNSWKLTSGEFHEAVELTLSSNDLHVSRALSGLALCRGVWSGMNPVYDLMPRSAAPSASIASFAA